MALLKFLHILTVVSLAVLHVSFDALPVNALSLEHGRDLSHAHIEIAKKRGQPHSSKKCRPRPSSASQSPIVSTTYNSNSAPSSNPSKPTSTTSSKSAPTNAPASSTGSKVMFPWSNNEQRSIPNFATGPKRLIYNWQVEKYVDIDLASVKNVEFVPTAANKELVATVPSILKAGYATYCKSFNEPELSGQADIAPQEAFQLWRDYLEPLTQLGYHLIGPACTAAGMDWMKTFLGLCEGHCTIYAMDFHYYGLTGADFMTSVNSYHNLKPELPLWITEVGCHDYSGQNKPCTSDVFDAFFPSVMDYVEKTTWILEVGWFGFFKPSEMPMNVESVNSMITCSSSNNADCVPNSLGKQYLNYN